MERENIFDFRPELQLVAENLLLTSYPRFFNNSGEEQILHGLSLIRMGWDSFTKDALNKYTEIAGKKINPAIAQYYLLMGLRKLDPELFPPHDISLLFANLIQAQYAPSILYLDTQVLLPSAILLLSRGWKLKLANPRLHPGKGLRQLMPEAKIISGLQSLEGEYVRLSMSRLLRHNSREENNTDENLIGSFFLDSWDFLGVKSNEYSRRFWLEKNSISGILQLPRLKRQAWNYYSAILHCNKHSSTQVRMVNMESPEAGEVMLDQRLALSLMLDPANNTSSLDVSKSELEQDPVCNFTPSIWLRKRNAPEIEGLRLGDCAQIIRCQLPRKKFKEVEPLKYGLQEDGSSIVREVGMAALQPESGFLLPESGDQVNINFKSQALESKFRLKTNDIIFSFRGTQESLGRVGFVNQDPVMTTITGPAFCIIRTLGKVDPKWLYWFLQTEEVRANILTRSSGKSLLNISTNDIKDLVIRLPEESRELNYILDLHEEISKEVLVISDSIRKLSKNAWRIQRNLNERDDNKD